MSHQPVWPLPCSWAGEIRPDILSSSPASAGCCTEPGPALDTVSPHQRHRGLKPVCFSSLHFLRMLFSSSQPADLPLLSQGAPLISAMLPQAPGLCPRVYFSQEWGGERFLHETPPGFSLKSWWFWFRAIVEVAGGHCAQLWLHWVPRHC